jgi:hypothetical protein
MSRFATALVDVGRQILVGRQEFVPPRYGIAALTSGDVGGEMRPSAPRTQARYVPRFGAP